MRLVRLSRRTALIRLVAAVAAVPAGLGAAWLAAGSRVELSPPAAAVLALVVGWAYIGCGVLTWDRPQGNRLGRVMVFVGYSWLATFLSDAQGSALFTVGTALEGLYLAAFAYLVLTVPTGRLEGGLDRLLFAAATLFTVVGQWVWLTVTDSSAGICAGCPANALLVHRDDTISGTILVIERVGGVLVAAGIVVRLAWRWHHSTPPQRRAVGPIWWAGGVTFLVLGVTVVVQLLGTPLDSTVVWLLKSVLVSIAVAVAAVLVQRRLAHASVVGLVVQIGGARDLDLRDALARTLGDPSLELAYWSPGRRTYLRPDGRPVTVPEDSGPRSTTIVKHHGEAVAALVHDRWLTDNRPVIDGACAAAALSLENERLHAELLARLGELQASGARLARAAEDERRRIECDLHDGVQQRLVSAVMSLGLAECRLATNPAAAASTVAEAKQTLLLTLGELRHISHGIRPAILVERGLAAAVDDLVRRSAVPTVAEIAVRGRLAAAVESAAFYVISEALTNVAKHAYATQARVDAQVRPAPDQNQLLVQIVDDGVGGADADGHGLRGLADRIEALGGHLTITSPVGQGTNLQAQLPCG